MIVIHRMEVTDEQRSALSLRLHPKALKRLATGKEIKQYQSEGWAKITAPEQSDGLQISNKPAESVESELREEYQALSAAGLVKHNPVPPFDDHLATTDEPPTMQQAHSRLTGAPEDPVKAALFHINNAMFAVTNAMRRNLNSDNPGPKWLDAADTALMDCRELLITELERNND